MQRAIIPFVVLPLMVMLIVTIVSLSVLAFDQSGGNMGWNQQIFLQSLFVILLTIGPLLFVKQSIPFISARTGASLVFMLLFGLWPIAYMVNPEVAGDYTSLWVRSDNYFIQALWYAILGIFCFQIGYLLPFGQRIAKKIGPPRRRRWIKQRIVMLAIVASVASLLSALAIWAQLGGLNTIGVLFGRAKVALDGYHYLALGIVLLRASILVAWAYSILRKFPRWMIWSQIVLYSVVSLSIGGRNQVISLWLMLFFMHILLTRKTFSFRSFMSFRVFVWGAAVLAASVVLMIVIRGFRTGYDASIAGAGLIVLEGIGGLGVSIMREFDQLEVFSTVVAIAPTQLPFWKGQSYLDILTLPIPRSLWEGKPVPARLILGQMTRGRDVGIPMTMVGEFYINFGLYGIAVGMSLFGVICKALDRWTYWYRDNPAVIIIFVFVLSNLPIILTRYFYGWFAALLIFLVMLWIVIRLTTARGSPGNS